MTTEITTLTTSEAAARVGISNQYLRFLLSKGKGPKGTREGKGGRGGGYKFTSEDIDAWDTARVKRAPKGSKKGMGEEYAAAVGNPFKPLSPAAEVIFVRTLLDDSTVLPDPQIVSFAADKQARLEAAGWNAGSAEDFLVTGNAAECPDEESDWDKDCSQGEFGPE